MHVKRNSFLLIGLLLSISGFAQVQSLWINLGTTANGTGSFDGFFGLTGEKAGGYLMFGIGEGDYEVTPAEDYTGFVSVGQANAWGDPIIGYGSKTGLVVWGGGLMINLNNQKKEEPAKPVDWILFGLEGGSDGPIYQIRRDPSYILGGGTYALEDPYKSPTKLFNVRAQYVRDLDKLLLGIGGVIGSHPGLTLNIGYRFGA